MTMLKRSFITIAVICWLLLMVSNFAMSSLSPQQAAERLAGKRSKTWVFVRFEMFLGKDDACTQGETWTFNHTSPDSTEGSLTIKTCSKNHIVKAIHNWRINLTGNIDLVLDVNKGQKYTLLFPASAQANKEKMALRNYSKKVSQATVDRVFTYERD